MVRSRAVLMVLVATSSTSAAPRKSKPAIAPAPAAANDTPDATPPPTSSHSEGDYGGVSPDHPSKPDPNAKPTKKPTPGTLSWIGFEAKDGGAEIFLQSVNPFELTQYVAGSTLVVVTKLSRLGQNTWRDVDTRYFDSPVSHIVAKYVGAARATKTEPAHGAGVEVRVAFKNAKDAHEASVRATTEADGLYYAYLTFGGGAGQPSMAEPEK
jgi:hypothetical protein